MEQIQVPKVWIAVLHYSGLDHTRACLRSLLELEQSPDGILIADNCSLDQGAKALAAEFPDFDYLILPENLGFAGGSNAAVKYCIERGAQWVWLLNNDTEVEKDSLERLKKSCLSEPAAGVLGAAVLTGQGDKLQRSGTGQISFARAKTFERGAVDDQKETIACQWLSGCNLFLNSQAFTELGGFDESFFLYFEDVDLCWRLNQRNWLCLFVPGARVKHIGGASTSGKLAVWRSYYYTRNRLHFFLKHKKGLLRLPILFSIYAHLLRHLLVLPLRGQEGRRQLKAELLGLFDYHQGRLGKAACLDF